MTLRTTRLALARPYSRASFPQLVGRSARSSSTLPAMPLDLTDAELASAAQACRAMAHQERECAKKLENPTTRGPIEAAAQRYAALAAKVEAVRRKA